MNTEANTADLREYLRVLRARKYEVALVTFVLVLATLFFSFRQTPIYEGDARILVKPVQNPNNLSLSQAPNLETERELILSQVVARSVQQQLHLTTPVDGLLRRVGVQVITDTEVLVVKYQDPSPAVAAKLANGFASAYVDFRSQQALTQFQQAAGAVQRRIDQVKADLTTLGRQIGQTTDPNKLNELTAERDTLIAQQVALQGRLLDLTSGSSTNQEAAQIIQQAEVPTSPVSPNKVRNGALALIAGLALGVGFAFLRERLDDRVKSREEIERRVGAPVLAVVPKVDTWRKQDDAYLVLASMPKSPVSEAYRTLATNIQYLGSREGLKVILVTSPLAGEGKTTTSANLAVALAQGGRRVILASADLRKPRLHRFFNVPNDRGLSDLLAGAATLAQVARDPGVPNLRVIAGGSTPANPAALLGGPSAATTLTSLRDVADFIIIDTPPVLAVADASILAPLADGTLFVMDGNYSSRSAMIQTRDQLLTAGARIFGVVYNNFDTSQSKTYPYHYYYHSYYTEYQAEENGAPNGSKATRLGRRRSASEPHAAELDRTD